MQAFAKTTLSGKYVSLKPDEAKTQAKERSSPDDCTCMSHKLLNLRGGFSKLKTKYLIQASVERNYKVVRIKNNRGNYSSSDLVCCIVGYGNVFILLPYSMLFHISL